MAAASAVKSSVCTLDDDRVAAGAPSARAVASDTTAFTPPMPSVPNATTGSRLRRPPGREHRAAERDLVQLAHRVGDGDAAVRHALPQGVAAPVGRAANDRNCDGSTPTTAVAAPLTGILTASIRSACTSPGSRDTAVSSPAGSENGATTSRSAWTVRRSGATGARRGPPR